MPAALVSICMSAPHYDQCACISSGLAQRYSHLAVKGSGQMHSSSSSCWLQTGTCSALTCCSMERRALECCRWCPAGFRLAHRLRMHLLIKADASQREEQQSQLHTGAHVLQHGAKSARVLPVVPSGLQAQLGWAQLCGRPYPARLAAQPAPVHTGELNASQFD